MTRLPIDPLLPEIVETVARNASVVLRASPGSGKTTRVPPALLSLPSMERGGEVVVLEPRRLAARLAATRVAEERGETPGQTIGYQFRFETVAGARTRIRFMTEGTFVRRLLGDPSLRGTAVVVLDEFHERHLQSDLALAAVRRLQGGSRPDLKLLVMSATLDTGPLASFLGNCPVKTLEAPIHPVTIRHLESPPARSLDREVAHAVKACWSEMPGASILVFLPGMREILSCARALEPFASHAIIAPLHGSLSREEQDRALVPAHRPRIILATNVAESSLTIEGVSCVVDSGLHRQASHSWWSGLPSLRTRPISRASAAQRAGRAGRTGPGLCLRLYTEVDFLSRPPFERAEIARSDLAQAWLELKGWGVSRPAADLPWLEPPPPASAEAAEALLFRLGAVAKDGKVTPLGRDMTALPTHPRFARLLLEAEKRGCLEAACRLVAVASEDGFPSLDALEAADPRHLGPAARRTARQLRDAFPREVKSGGEDRDSLARALLAGFPDRVARRRATASARTRSGEEELVFSGGGSGTVPLGPLTAHADTFVAVQVEETQRAQDAKAKVRVGAVCAIETEWLLDLEPSGIKNEESHRWDGQTRRVISVSRLLHDSLVLEETLRPASPSPEVARVLIRQGLGLDLGATASRPPSLEQWVEALSSVAPREEIETTLARLALVRPSPAPVPEWLEGAVLRAAEGCVSLGDLAEVAWETALPEAAGAKAAELARLAPTHWELPSGRRARVTYVLGREPYLASRLQDFFGLRESPRILGGKVPLTLHLLAPNQRAVQVTTDLAGFWERHYPAIRKELSRKYPRHAWPEDPTKPVPMRTRKP